MKNRIISHYKILEKLGEGGMGVVYKAQDTKLDRIVALKFLPKHLLCDEEAKTRFVHEAKAASALNHTNITTIYEIDEVESECFICMEYVEGKSIKELVEEKGLSIEEILKIAIQTAEGLSRAHQKDIIHRDVKSDNIMLTDEGAVKIMDFGLAKLKGVTQLTKPGSTLGTVAYMSPEQAQGKEADQRSDIFSFGVILYEMITGKLPFEGEHEAAVIYSIVNEIPEPLARYKANVPEGLQRIVDKALEKDKEERYQHVDEMLVDMRSITKSFGSWRTEPRPTRAKRPKTKRVYLYVGLLILFLLFFVGKFYFFSGRSESIDSIAVLPFENKSENPSMEYLSDEIPASIINSISRLSNLRVVPRSTVFRYKGQKDNLATVGSELNVATVLTGQVSLFGDNLIIRAELVNIKNDTQIWGDRFERKITDLLEIEEEITKEISEALQLRLTGEEKAKLVKRYTENIEAYRAYLEGRFWWNKRSQAGFAKANLLFNKAIAIDPNYALAYAGLAEYYCMLSIHLAKPEPFIRQGRIAAEKALSIDETLAEAHAALGWIKLSYDWDWLGAERSFKQAIQLNPRYPTAYNWYAALLSIINRHEEAIRYMTQAQEYDPGSAIINRDLGVIYAWAGDFEKAINQLQFTIDMDPDFSPAYFHMGIVYVWLKKYDLAIEYFKKVRAMTGDFFDIIGALGYTYAKSGQKEAALSELKKLEDLAKNQDTRAFEFCLIHTGLGNNDKAFEWLDIACENHEFGVALLGCESELWFEDLLPDPRFKEFLTRIGIEK